MEEQKEKKIVFCYGRVSTTKESQDSSIDTQEIFFKDYVSYHKNWILGKVFLEKGSGTQLNEKRIEFTKLLTACAVKVVQKSDGTFGVNPIEGKKAECDLILCKSTSRFGRSDFSMTVIASLAIRGIGVVFADMGGACSLNKNELQMISNQLGNDSYFSKALSYNARWSYIKAIENRNMIYGTDNLFGFTRIKDKDNHKKVYLIPESPEHVKIINEMFEMYLSGYGFRRIQQYVEQQGFKSKKPNKKKEIVALSVSGIKDLLENEKYMGYIQKPIRNLEDNKIGAIQRKNRCGYCNYELIKVPNITPVVSEELFRAVQEKRINKPITKKSRGVKQHISKYGKLLVCTDCYNNFQKTYDSKKNTIYVCANRKGHGISACNMPFVSESFLDEQIELLKKDFKEIQQQKKNEILEECNYFKSVILYNYFNTDNSKKIVELKTELAKFKIKMQELQAQFLNMDTDNFVMQTNFVKKEIDIRETELSKLNNSFTDLQLQINKIETTEKELNDLLIKDDYSSEDIINQLELIEVYKKGNDTLISVKELEELNSHKFKRDEVELMFTTSLQGHMMYYVEELRHTLENLTRVDLNTEQQKDLEQLYLDML